jgi:hypothetical protein
MRNVTWLYGNHFQKRCMFAVFLNQEKEADL